VTAPGALPRVSVILRTKDRPGLLAEALASLRAQSLHDFETVLVNAGGPIPEPVLAPAPGRGLRVVVPAPPGRRSQSLNAGLAAARGLFVAYLDDDDLYRPTHLERLAAALESDPECGAAFSSVDQIRQHRGPDGLYRDGEILCTYGRPFDPNRILFRNDVPLIALLHRSDLVEKTGPFDEELDLYEDWDFLIRLSAVTRFRFVPETTAVYRLRDDGTNATTAAVWHGPESDAARRTILSKHASRITPDAALALADLHEQEVWLRENDIRALRSRLAEVVESVARLEGDLRDLRAEADRQRAEAERQLGDAARQLADATGREAALAAERERLGRELDAIHRSRWFRLATRWWKLRSLLSR
jgi:GT2 family glycosyltransferase